MALALIGVLLSLALLITLAYRGHSVIIVAPLTALVATLFSGAPLLATYTQIFMPAAGKFFISFFPLFLVGAIFGQLMTVSGYAHALAVWISDLLGPKRAVLATVIATTLLTYGGVSAWVIAFTMYPIAKALFEEASIPKRLMPAAIALGIFTFATAALPGSPQIHNAIPTKFFGTTTYAAPLLGTIGGVVTFALGMAWLEYRARTMVAAGEDFAYTRDPQGRARAEKNAPSTSDADILDAFEGTPIHNKHLQGLIALFPILVVVVMNLLFVYVFSKTMNFDYLADKKFGETSIGEVMGLWSVTVALATAIIAVFIMRPRRVNKYIEGMSTGAKNSVLPVLTTASEVAYGAVIASLAVFAMIRDGIFSISDNALVVAGVSTAAISGITGSSSGGLSITLTAFGQQLAEMANQQGISLELLHRTMAMASVSFDSLPHNGAIITLLLVCGLTHRDSYKDIGVVTVIVPLIGLLVVMGSGLALS